MIYYLFSLSGIFKENHLSQFLYVYFLMLLQRSCFEKNPAITLLWKIWERQKWARCKSLGPLWYLIFLIHSEPFHIFIFMVNIFIIFFNKNKIIIESWTSIFWLCSIFVYIHRTKMFLLPWSQPVHEIHIQF